jgi:hypothetical protein
MEQVACSATPSDTCSWLLVGVRRLLGQASEDWAAHLPGPISSVLNIRGWGDLPTAFRLEDLLRIELSADAWETGRDAG